MRNLLFLSLACSLLVLPKPISADTGLEADSKKVSAVEYLYADVSDANSILATIDSGLLSTYQGKDRAAWQQVYRKKRAKLAKKLEKLPASGLSDGDTRAIAANLSTPTVVVGSPQPLSSPTAAPAEEAVVSMRRQITTLTHQLEEERQKNRKLRGE